MRPLGGFHFPCFHSPLGSIPGAGTKVLQCDMADGDVIVLEERRPRSPWLDHSIDLNIGDSIEIFIIDGRMEVWYGESLAYEGPPFKTLRFMAPGE